MKIYKEVNRGLKKNRFIKKKLKNITLINQLFFYKIYKGTNTLLLPNSLYMFEYIIKVKNNISIINLEKTMFLLKKNKITNNSSVFLIIDNLPFDNNLVLLPIVLCTVGILYWFTPIKEDPKDIIIESINVFKKYINNETLMYLKLDSLDPVSRYLMEDIIN